MKKIIIIIFSIFLISLIMFLLIYPNIEVTPKLNCLNENHLYCESDSDCVCATDHGKYKGCFIGNINYYNSCVDKKLICSDNCGMGDTKLPIQCINNKCLDQYQISKLNIT